MKRALAERAKQQRKHETFPSPKAKTLQVPISPSRQSHSSQAITAKVEEKVRRDVSSSDGMPSVKIKRLESSTSVKRPPMPQSQTPSPSQPQTPKSRSSLQTDTFVGKYPSKSPTSRKRARNNISNISSKPSVSPSDDEDDNSESNPESSKNGFYLQHQNRALASELYAYKHKISLLERERSCRRRSCSEIGEILRQMEGCWKEIEVGILGALRSLESKRVVSSLVKIEEKRFNENLPSIVKSSECDTVYAATTGKGSDVECVGNIIGSIKKLAHSSILTEKEYHSNTHKTEKENKTKIKNEPGSLIEFKKELENDLDLGEFSFSSLSTTSSAFSHRCTNFQQFLIGLIRDLLKPINPKLILADNRKEYAQHDIFQAADLQKEITLLKASVDQFKNEAKECIKDRNKANESERRVRRGLYRVASGRMNVDEVMKEMEKDGLSTLDDVVELQHNSLSSPSSVTCKTSTVKAGTSEMSGKCSRGSPDKKTWPMLGNGKIIDADTVLQMEKQIQDLEEISAVRNNKIAELVHNQEVREKKINSILVSVDSNNPQLRNDNDVLSSMVYIECASKLTTSKKYAQDLSKELMLVKDRWAETKGDLLHVKKSMGSLEIKHNKRLKELVNISGEAETGMVKTSSSDGSNRKDHTSNTMRITELEHKLKHALDNVRQCEAIRASLSEANMMNEALQSKLDELKTKNAALVAKKVEARALSVEASSSSSLTSLHKLSHRESSVRDKDLHKMKKQLTAAVISKDQAKAKQERAEKERDSLMKTNARLIKQSIEKDDMNAKSLSTILHLKQVSEQLEQEKDLMNEKLKGVQQLALAARLAANAKERVEEESINEKQLMQKEVTKLKIEKEIMSKKKAEIELSLSKQNSQFLLNRKESKIIQNRCDELVSMSTAFEKEKEILTESLAIAKKDALKSPKQAADFAYSLQSSVILNGGKENMFTKDQLTTQVNHLKSRLACPVCNTRDKEVILLRCRHMFCRHCVDKNIKNRSRKCPACAQRFDTKDVSDVWL